MNLKKLFKRGEPKVSLSDTVSQWFSAIEPQETIPSSIKAINIGLFESDGGYCAYISGAEQYDENDDDWACESDFTPDEKYLYFIGEKYESIEWEEFLNIISSAIKSLIPKFSFLSSRIVTIGFDSGELTRLN